MHAERSFRPAPERFFKSARQNAKGEIVVETYDRIAAINVLNAMQSGALAATRSMSLNLNAFIPAARDVHDPGAALRLFDAFGGNEG